MTARIIILNIIISIVLSSCDSGRTSSKERLEKACDIVLPKDNVVIKDEYQDMLQDYAVIYKFTLSKTSLTEFISSIKKSKYYNPSARHTGVFTDNMFLSVDSTRSVWCQSKEGYRFHKSGNKIPTYSIEVDTITMTVEYQEID